MKAMRNKKILLILSMLFVSLCFSGCKKDDQATSNMLAFAVLQEHVISDENSVKDPLKDNVQDPDNTPTPEPTQDETDVPKEPDGTDDINKNSGEPAEADNTGAGDGSGDPVDTSGMSDSVEVFLSNLSDPQEGRLLSGDGGIDTYFYTQIDERWAELYYGGTDTIKQYACGPTSMSIVISTLTDVRIDPVQMSAWAKENGYWYSESGSLHSIIPDAAEAFGLKAEGVQNTPQAKVKIKKALEDGKLVVALMGKGQFTQSGHFIVLRGLDANGKVLVAEPASEERTEKSWDIDTIVGEAKSWAAANGPFWIISK